VTRAAAGSPAVVATSAAGQECCAAPGEVSGPVAALDDAALAAAAKALGHPVRVRILRLLAERRACVTGDLLAELPLAQSTVYEHLRILREAGLIQGEIDGPRVSYCVNQAGLAAFKQAVAGL
jgi:ArsR family transcriptional regulator